MMSSASPDLKAVWFQRLTDTKLRLEFARAYLKEVMADSPVRQIDNSDGHYAYQKAIRSESSALREYARVLRIFTELTVHGVIPDEAAWLKSRGKAE